MVNQDNHPKSLRDYLRLFFTGIAMGSADTVPGVSGGTMALILGVYEDLVDGIKSVNLNVIKLGLQFKIKQAMDLVPWQFLMALGFGILAAILTLARILTHILETDPQYLFAFFFGLVIASAIAVGARIKNWTPRIWTALGVGTAVALAIALQSSSEVDPNLFNLFISGMFAIMAMILPGISGAFILLILGQYHNVLTAVKEFQIGNIIAIGLGCLLGLVIFSRLLSWLLKNYYETMIAVLVGFMVGSLYNVWPWGDHSEELVEKSVSWPGFGDAEVWIALGLAILGFVLVSVLDHLQSRANPFVLIFRKQKETEL